MADEDEQVVVIDVGSQFIRGGFAGDDDPQTVFPSMVGRRPDEKKVFVGNEAWVKRQSLKTSLPVEKGMVTSWDDMEKVYEHLFLNELRVAPEETPVVLSDAPLTPPENREKLGEMMFETFHTPAFFVQNEANYSLYASGRTTGLVVCCGDSVCRTVPVYEGFAIQHAIQTMDFGGSQLTKYLTKILSERGYSLIVTSDLELYRDMKEKLGYVALDFDDEIQLDASSCSTVDKEYTLPDGQIIKVGAERFRCCEPLFQPHILGKDVDNLPEMCYKSIRQSDLEAARELYQNVILSGGTTLFPGFADRLQKELTNNAMASLRVKLIASPERKHSAWIGGSIYGCLSYTRSSFVTKQEYDEFGPKVINRKCLT